MKKPSLNVLCLSGVIFVFGAIFSGCGYSTRTVALGSARTIFIEPFKNKILYGTESDRNLYLPLLEVNVTNAVIDRFLFDGNLKIAKSGNTDLTLKGELINYQRDALRYTDNNDVQEYRITITVSLSLWDNVNDKELWSEPSFSGDTTYFVNGAQAKSENVALQDALTDLARRIVERTIEDW